MSKRWWLTAAGLMAALALAGLWVIVLNSDLPALFQDSQRLASQLRGQGLLGPLTIVVLQIGQVLLAPIPGQAVGVAAGYLFGTLCGTCYCLLGTVMGSCLAFKLARVCGRPLVERVVPPQTLTWLDEGAKRRGLLFFALVFLLPFLPDDLACFAGGLTKIPIPALMLVTLAARAPGIWVSVWIGAHAEGLSAAQWVMLIAGAGLLVSLTLLRGERLQEWLMMHLPEKSSAANSRPPSPGA